MAESFVIEKGSSGKYRFNLRASGNYETLLTSETYETKAGAEGGIDSVRRNAKDDGRYMRKTAKDESPYFTLTASKSSGRARCTPRRRRGTPASSP